MPKHQPTYSSEELQTEEWRPVVGWEEYYSVSNIGRVRREKPAARTRPGHMMSPCPDSDGYLIVTLTGDKMKRTGKVHQLVAVAFVGPFPAGYTVDHKDDDKTNNRADNLQYLTFGDNTRKAWARPGYKASRRYRPKELAPRGEGHPRAKITEDDVRSIHVLWRAGWHILDIARRFGIGRTTAQHIVDGDTWKHIT